MFKLTCHPAHGGLALVAACVLAVPDPAPAQPFVHPGCLSTANDLSFVKAKVAAGAQPWKGSWDRLTANSYAQLAYNPNPQATVCRGGACPGMGYPENYMAMARDAAAAYQMALRYHISGNTNYANKAVQVMDAWANTLTLITGDSNALLALGAQGYQFACAAELMRGYAPWINSGGFARFQSWLLAEFYPGVNAFLQGHNGTCSTHYWANWDLFAMSTLISIGVVCDRRDLYTQAISYYTNGIGAGAASKFLVHTHPGYLGQCQESGRDQGHCTLDPILLGVFCEIAWNQGDDMYSYLNNALLQVSEYVAKYNVQPLTNSLPFVCYMNCEYYSANTEAHGITTGHGAGSRGIVRPGWALIYNHYANRRGLAAPWTGVMSAQVSPEGGGGHYGPNSGGFDQLGFTTLTHTRDPLAVSPAPRALSGDVRGNSVVLSWWGSVNATGYNVKRATDPSGPYSLVAASLPAETLCYTNLDLALGTNYHYVVSAMLSGVETANSAPLTLTANRRLGGTILGSSGSYNNAGATRERVFDDSLKNFFDASAGNGQWAGLDLGASNIITQVRYCPRPGFAGRMVGGQFQGCNVADFSSGVVTLFSVPGAPADGVLTTQSISNITPFRYVRYFSPNGGWGNIAEAEFHGYKPVSTTPVQLKPQAAAGQLNLSWPDDHTGWRLEGQTNAAGHGLGPGWFNVPGAAATNQVDIQIDNAHGSVFFRLVYP